MCQTLLCLKVNSSESWYFCFGFAQLTRGNIAEQSTATDHPFPSALFWESWTLVLFFLNLATHAAWSHCACCYPNELSPDKHRQVSLFYRIIAVEVCAAPGNTVFPALPLARSTLLAANLFSLSVGLVIGVQLCQELLSNCNGIWSDHVT